MKIAFISGTRWEFTCSTPLERPFGGSESALCYLAAELAKLGEQITLFNGNPSPVTENGVEFRNYAEASTRGALNAFDIVVVSNTAVARWLRRDLEIRVPLVHWIQHADDQPGVQDLSRLNERKSWTRYAFVSEWQRNCFEKKFWVPRERSRVMRNAVSPAFLEREFALPWYTTGAAPTLVYTSTPFRGLDVLLKAFPVIRSAVPDVRLRIFSSMALYQLTPEQDAHTELYALARATEGVEYVGPLGQRRLSEELSGIAALAFPSTFAETSCISVPEAMVSGGAIFTTRLGALPETTGGHADAIDYNPNKDELAKQFAELTVTSLRFTKDNPDAATELRNARRKYVQDSYSWPARAQEWMAFFSEIMRERS